MSVLQVHAECFRDMKRCNWYEHTLLESFLFGGLGGGVVEGGGKVVGKDGGFAIWLGQGRVGLWGRWLWVGFLLGRE